MNKGVTIGTIITVWLISMLLVTACGSSSNSSQTTQTIAGVSFNMKYVPGGTFLTAIDDPDLVGSQTVSAFWMGETEVTYELWSAVYTWATSHGYTFEELGRQGAYSNTGPVGTNQDPVTNICWWDAMVWCNAASELAGLAPVYKYQNAVVKDSRYTNAAVCDNVTDDASSNGFRLPGMWQWECAARYKDGASWMPGSYASGATAEYYDFNADNAVAWFGDSLAQGTGNTTTTQPVKGKTANALGIYDMSGNVSEWCFDWYPGYSGERRAYRGGSWYDSADYLQVSWVARDWPGAAWDDLGFRLMRTK